MVNFPPLLPSASWMARYMDLLSEGKSETQAVALANTFLSSGKEFSRFHLEDAHGKLVTMSIPVEGGSKNLRNLGKVTRLSLSHHGNWKKTIPFSIDAALGRKPFYRYLEPSLVEIFQSSGISNIEELNSAIFRVLQAFLMHNINSGELKGFWQKDTLQKRGKEIAGMVNPQVSVLQPLAIFGPETLLGLMVLGKS